jgi:GT2 family glycosyltransferase
MLYFSSHHGVRFAVGAGDVISKQHSFLRHIPSLQIDSYTIENWRNDRWIMQQSCFWSSSLWEEVGGVDTSLTLLMDVDLWFRFSKVTTTYMIPDTLAVMRYYKAAKTVRLRSTSYQEMAYVYARYGAFDCVRAIVAELVSENASQSQASFRISGPTSSSCDEKASSLTPLVMTADLFIGVTSWNSQLFLPSCLESIRATTIGLPIQLHVVDNCSNDQSAEIARNYGAAVTVKSCTQRQALNHLIEFCSMYLFLADSCRRSFAEFRLVCSLQAKNSTHMLLWYPLKTSAVGP